MRRTALLLCLALVGCAEASSSTNADGTPVDTGTGSDASDAGGADGADDTGATDAGTTDVVTGAIDGLVINEVAAAGDPEDWFELYNGGDESVVLTGFTFTDGLADNPGRATFAAGTTIEPGGYLLVELTDETAGFGIGGDEELAVQTPDGDVVDFVDWDEGDSPAGGSYARIPNGTGDFVTVETPTPGAENVDGGGGDDPVCGDGDVEGDEECDDGNTDDGDGCSADCENETVEPGEADVVINEVVANATDDGPDAIELVNRGDAVADIGGWSVTDDAPEEDGHTWAIPDGTTIEPGGYVLFERGDDSFDFGLGGDDGVWLYDADGVEVDVADWDDGEAEEGTSFGRLPDATGDFVTMTTPTPGVANVPNEPVGPCGNGELELAEGEACDDGNTDDDDGCSSTCTLDELGGGVVINEVIAKTPDSGDIVELYNPNDFDVAIGGFTLEDAEPERDGHVWAYPAEVIIAAESFFVVEQDTEGAFTFGLSDEGDSVVLRTPEGDTVDATSWTDGQAPEGQSWGRFPDGDGDFGTRTGPTPGLPNAE